MIDWTATSLPNPSSFTLDHLDSNIRKRTEDGSFIQRARYTAEQETGTVSFRLSKEQFRVFKGVWKHFLTNGTDWFTMDLPVGGFDVLTNCQVRFVSSYKAKHVNFDNTDISLKIEFFEVETIDEVDLLDIVDGFDPPYGDGGLRVLFNDDIGEMDFLDVNTSTGYNAVRWWDGSIDVYANSNISKTFPTTNEGITYRADIWSCISLADSTKLGYVETISINNTTYGPTIEKFDQSKEPSLNYFLIQPVSKLKGWDVDDTLDLQFNTVSTSYLSLSDLNFINTVNLTFTGTPTLVSFTIKDSPSVQNINLTGSFVCSRFSLEDNDIQGHLDLSNLTADSAGSNSDCYGMPFMTSITLGSLTQNTIDLYDNGLTAVNFTTDVFVATDMDVKNNSLSVEAIGIIVDSLYASDSAANLQISGNPAWVSGALDATHPDTVSILATAAAHNITITA